jgi:hypothetical protein
MKHKTEHGCEFYAVHEYYDLDTGPAWTENPITVDGQDVTEVRRMLFCILLDIEKHGVKDYDAN